MKTETYKGRKLKTVKGKQYGYAGHSINGVSLGQHQGDEQSALNYMRRTIDFIDQEPINGDRWAAEWYAPGTFELCEAGHPKEIGGDCRHSWCEAQATEAAHDAPRHTERVSYRVGRFTVNATITGDVDSEGRVGVIDDGDRCAQIHYVHPRHLARLVPDMDKLHEQAIELDRLITLFSNTS